MRVDVLPRRIDVPGGQPVTVVTTIVNTGSVIGGYTVRVLGADPTWVELDTAELSLFPEESATVTASITVPPNIAAGDRRIAIQVRELTEPYGTSITDVDLRVAPRPKVVLQLDPLILHAGRRARFNVLVENTGNTVLTGRLAGDDPEAKVRFDFDPEVVSLAPGDHAVVDMNVKARQPFMGNPAVRTMALFFDEAPLDAHFAPPVDPDKPREEADAKAQGTFVQKALISRGPLSLIGLLAAVTVFAVIITMAMGKLVGQSNADRDLALQVAAARNAAPSQGTSGLSGTVRLLTSGAPVRGVSVNVFSATDVKSPLASTATDTQGAWTIANLPAGKYKLSFRGAGLVQLWFPNAASDADATAVELKAGQTQKNLDVRLGGVPASISGSVVGEDVSGATVFLMSAVNATTGTPLPVATGNAPVTTAVAAPSAPGIVIPPSFNGEAVVKHVPVGSDGTFSLADVPSPTVYDLVVTKVGYATSAQRIDIGAGENRSGVSIRLLKGDGQIQGHVNTSAGGLGGVTLTATSGQSVAKTVSLTTDDVGLFTLRDLPTPATFTIVASANGYAAQTVTLSLTAGQSLTGVVITLDQSAGTLRGTVSATEPGGPTTPAPGVTVTVTNGELTVQTVTESGQGGSQKGAWHVGGLQLPGTYTVTFARDDLAAQTVSVVLDSSGAVNPPVGANGILTTMQSATAVVYGTITQKAVDVGSGQNDCNISIPSQPAAPKGEAVVTLNSGTATYTVTTSTVPNAGQYYFGAVPPGTYTESVSIGGTTPTSQIVTLTAGQKKVADMVLDAPASIRGCIFRNGVIQAGWVVELYRADQYPTVPLAITNSDASGIFSFGTVDAPQNYIIQVRQSVGASPEATSTFLIQTSKQAIIKITADRAQ